MFEKEAEEYLKKHNYTSGFIGYFASEYCKQAYIDSAEPREKRIVDLEKENAELKEKNEKLNVLIADVIEAFASCSYNDDFEMAQAGKEIYELFYGGLDPKEVFHNAEVPKSSRQLLAEAKEIIKKFSDFVNNEVDYDPEYPQEHTDLWNKLCEEAEQFLKECEE